MSQRRRGAIKPAAGTSTVGVRNTTETSTRCPHDFFAQFLKHVIAKFPYAIECVQTDNGFEFTNEMGNSKKKTLTMFEKALAQFGIQHKKIRAFTPRHNGKVERSHRKDNEYFYASHKFYSFEDFEKQLAVHQRKYNDFPMRPLNWRSPKQVLFAFPNV